MPKSTFANLPEEKRRRIVDAAVDEFGSRPYATASLDRVVERAGISKGSLYQYFDGKADLYRWLLTEHLPSRKLAAIAQKASPTGGDVWETLEQAFRTGVAFAVAEPALNRLGARFFRDHEAEPELAPIAEAHRIAAEQWLTSLLRLAQARGQLRADLDLAMVTGLLAYALGEGMLHQIARRLGISLAELLEDPERVRGLGDADASALVSSVIDIFRRGAAVAPEAR